jgi:hypothetical protein
VECGYAGLIGVEALPHLLPADDEVPRFMLSSATGNLRQNSKGENLGEQLICAYPAPDLGEAKAGINPLDYRMTYVPATGSAQRPR